MSAIDLRGSGLRGSRRSDADDADPMASMANLADVMLVFACGLMVALVTLFNIDLSTATQMLREDQISQVQSPEELDAALKASDGTQYINMGQVFLDPTTGKYYMLSDSKTDDAVAQVTDNGVYTGGGQTDERTGSGTTSGGSSIVEVDRSQGGD
jgi:hypothetical protein